MADFTQLTAFLDSLKEEFGIPGCDISIWQDHKEIYRHWAGERTPGVAMNGNEWYNIFSCSKVSTMIAMLQLVEQGKLALDEPICKYLPAFTDMVYTAEDGSLKPISAPITVEQLMTMTAGLDYDTERPEFDELVKETNGMATTRQIVDTFAKHPLLYDPGTSFRYSFAHDVCGALIEAVTGMRFGEYLQANIYGPLGIADSEITFHPTDSQCATMAKYEAEENAKNAPLKRLPDRRVGRVDSPEFESGGGGLYSTVEAYVRVMDMLANDGVGATGARILRKETVDMCHESRLTPAQVENGFRVNWPTRFFEYEWGLCGRVMTHADLAKSPVGEFGWVGAAGCWSLADTENRLAIFYGEHILNYTQVIETQVHPVIRDMIYDCIRK